MSNRSRGRHRFEQPEPVDPEEQQRVDEAAEAFEHANTRSGLAKLVGMLMEDREKQLAPKQPDGQYEAADGTRFDIGGLPEMTPYHKAVAAGMSGKPMYGGTVEPWVRDQRRRRNKAARRQRRRNRRAAR